MSNKELDQHIANLESDLTKQERELDDLGHEEERLIIEMNLSKLVIMDKMMALHK